MKTHALQPLADMTILVTRPEGQGEGLARLIAEAGGRPLLAPLLAIAPVESPAEAQQRLAALSSWDWLVFVSANAVRQSLRLVPWAGQRPPGTRLAAVGEATAAALEQAGLAVDLIPYPDFNSETLLADPRLAEVSGQRILIVRGRGGREHMADVLRQRGAEVDYADVYRRVPVAAEIFAPALAAWQEGDLAAVVVTSGEALSHLAELLRGAALADRERPTLIVPGARIAGLARTLGWSQVMIAEQASDEAIVQSLKQLAHARKTGQGPAALLAVPPSVSPAEVIPPEPESTPTVAPGLPPSSPEPALRGEHPLTESETISAPAGPAPEPSLAETTPPSAEEKAPEQPQTKARGKGRPAAGETGSTGPKKSRSLAWVGYLILLGVVGLAVGGWFLLQELRSRQEGLGGQISDKSQQVQEVSHQMSAVQSELAALHSQLATLQNQFSGSDAKLERRLGEQGEQLDLKLDAARSELADAIQQIQRQLDKTRGDVLITDAEYLLNVANQKLSLVGDVKSVLAAMEAADQRLHESGDPAVYKVREVLAGEIAALRKIQAPDVVGVSARLLALEKKVPGLPLILPHAGTVKQHEKARDEAPVQQPDEAAQGDALDSALKGFKELVTVRRTDQPVEALLTPEQVEVLRQLLLLKLEATRAALLRNDDQLYRDSLSAAIDWLERHFDGKAPETRAMREELEALADRSLKVAYPDISQSMLMLQNIEKLRLEAEDAVLRGKSSSPAPVAAPVAPSVLSPAASESSAAQPKEETPVPAGQPAAPAEGSPPTEASPAQDAGERL